MCVLRYCRAANAQVGLADYSKLPSVPPVDAVFLLDPLVATGGTACAALTMLLDWGIPCEWLFFSHPDPYRMSRDTASKIKLLVVLGSEPGLNRIEENYPDLEVTIQFTCRS